MFTPYDWQEGIGNRAQYIEGKLAQGAPVLAISLDAGILIFTLRRQARKIYEIYDRLAFAAMGQQSDVEGIRLASLEFASREGYNRSEQDVTIQRVSTAISTSIKQAFSDFSSAPVVARSLFAEVNDSPAEDLFYVIDYDGDYEMFRGSAVVSGSEEMSSDLRQKLAAIDPSTAIDQALGELSEAWHASQEEREEKEHLRPEAVLVDRSGTRENRFILQYPEEF
jgi:proteasome alpha subunit